MDFFAHKTMRNLVFTGRKLLVHCASGDRDNPCGHFAELIPESFPLDMAWEDLPKHYSFRCKHCGSPKVRLKLEIEREWKRRLRR